MLKKDFILKLIEQVFESIAKMLKLNIEENREQFLASFSELLDSFFGTHQDNLGKLLDDDEKINSILLNKRLRNLQLNMFVNAGLIYFENSELDKAENCIKIIDKIQSQPTDTFEFPSEDLLFLEDKISELEQKLDYRRASTPSSRKPLTS